MKIDGFWIKHPRSKKPDTMLTLSVLATFTALAKFLLNGVVLTYADFTYNFGTVDAALVGAILLPTLGAYVGRKMKDSPDDALKSIGVTKKGKK